MSQNTLLVCVLCRFANTTSNGAESSPGQLLFDQLNEAIASSDQADAIHLQPVRCMGACRHACVVAFSAPNKLTFILSELSIADSVPDLLKFSSQYAACADGKVPYQQRPDTVKQKIHAVLPLLSTASLHSAS